MTEQQIRQRTYRQWDGKTKEQIADQLQSLNRRLDGAMICSQGGEGSYADQLSIEARTLYQLYKSRFPYAKHKEISNERNHPS